MTTEPADECPHCGAKMVRYKHRLNAGLLRGLTAIAAAREASVADLGLDYTDRCNFQKLRYWGLIEYGQTAEGTHRAGWWRITPLGHQWLEGKMRIPSVMWTYRGDPVAPDGERVGPEDVDDAYTLRPEWAEERQSIRLDPGYGDPVRML